MMRVLVIMAVILIGMVPVKSFAEILEAESCNTSDIQSAVDDAVDGDVVLVPGGICTWVTHTQCYASLRITGKAITLKGAGIDITTIHAEADNHFTPGCVEAEVPLHVVTPDDGNVRITGFTFDGSAGYDGIINVRGSSTGTFRIDNIKFTEFGVGRAIRTVGEVIGVIDHNIFNIGCGSIYVTMPDYAGDDYGDGSWKSSLNLGSSRAVYVEDNLYDFMDPENSLSAVDCISGGRFVFRKNTVNGTYVTTHGTETGGRERSCFSFEIYDNVFSSPSDWYTAMHLRGGTGVVFGNTASGYQDLVIVDNYRSFQSYDPWGKCDGSSPYDGNTAGMSGYPCIDQIGRSTDSGPGTDQALEPLYEWNNTLGGQDGDINPRDNFHIVEDRDFYNDTQRPGYTPYTYPHPIVLGYPTPEPPSDLREDNSQEAPAE